MATTPAIAPEQAEDAHPLVLRTFGDARFRTEGDIIALGYAADGSLWSVEEPGVLKRWDAAGIAVDRHFLSDLDTPFWFGPQAKWLAAACDELLIWNVADHSIAARIEQPSWTTALAFHPTESLIATGHDDGVIRLWNPANEELVAELTSHALPISALAFSADGTHLASAGEDREIRLWSVATKSVVRTLTGHTDRIPALAWHPAGNLLVSIGWDNTARVWDVASGEPRVLLNTHDDQVGCMTFSPDGRVLATADSGSMIHLWTELLTGQSEKRLPGYADEVRALAFSGDGRRLATGGTDRVIHIFDAQAGKLIAGRPVDSRHSLALWTTTPAALISNAADDGLRVWNIATGKERPSPLPAGSYRYVAASPDGRWIAATCSDASLHLWDELTKSHIRLEGSRTPANYLTWAADSQTFAAAATEEGTIWIWDIGKSEPRLLVIEATEGCSVEGVAFHPNGRLLLCGGIDFMSTSGAGGAVCVWDLQEKTRLQSIADGATCVAFDPTGELFAYATPDGRVVVCATDTGATVHELDGPEDDADTALAFTAQGLVATATDGTLRVWNPNTGALLSVSEFPTPIHDLVVAADGRLFTANGNTTAFELAADRLTEDE